MKDCVELPEDMLAIVLEKAKSSIDFLGCRLVCSSWRRIIMDHEIKASTEHQIPMLMVPGKKKGVWQVYDPAQNKFLEKLKLKVNHNISFSGSSAGWLVAVNEDYTITLHKPYFGVNFGKNQTICLPCLFPPDTDYYNKSGALYTQEYHVRKILVTADPVLNPEKCVIVAIFGEMAKLAFIRYAKDASWTVLDTEETYGEFDDVAYHENHFYAITYFNVFARFSVPESGDPIVTVLQPKPIHMNLIAEKRYLVKTTTGDLLQLVRLKCFVYRNCTTFGFGVLRLNVGDFSWTKVESLGDMAVFLGDNSSVAVRASDFHSCLPDHIYFNQDKDYFGQTHHFSDLGIYELGKKKLKKHFNIDSSALLRLPKRPLWILPKLM